MQTNNNYEQRVKKVVPSKYKFNEQDIFQKKSILCSILIYGSDYSPILFTYVRELSLHSANKFIDNMIIIAVYFFFFSKNIAGLNEKIF